MPARTRRNLARTLAALILAGGTATLATNDTMAADSKAADSTVDFADSVGAAWIKAMRAGDLDAVVKLYADDAVAWFPDEAEHNGSAAIRESYKAMLDTYTIVDASLPNGHHVGDATHRANWGNFTLSLKQKSDGKKIPMTGRYTDVQELRKGHWVYVADHASADPPPNAAAAK